MGTMSKYKRLDLDERENISRYLADNKSLAGIAVYLGRSKSTISRELKQAKAAKTLKLNKSQKQALARARGNFAKGKYLTREEVKHDNKLVAQNNPHL